MSSPLILAVGAVYVLVAISEARVGRYGMAIAWAGYALANVGLAWDAGR